MLNEILEAAFGQPINRAFCAAIVVLAALAIVGAFSRAGILARIAVAAPGLLTATGVLGTFVGILIGLLDFDVADITRSVPLLLEGMKTAFVTSVFGMGAGIVVKLVLEAAARPGRETPSKGVEDVLLTLEAIRAEGELTRKETASAMDRVRAALTGDNESSLVTQIQRLRTDVTDEIRESRRANAAQVGSIAEEIRGIATTLSENTSKAIIEALEGSIRDFNERITEQFGDNFKQLNIAVGRLLEWQENYRQQMVANAEALRQGAAGIEASRASLEAISTQADALVRAANDLRSLLDGLNVTRAEMDARLEAFQGMAREAAAAMPSIQAKLEDLTSGFARQAGAVAQQVAQLAKDLGDRFQAHEAVLQDGSSRFAASVGEAMTRAAEGFGHALHGFVEEARATQAEQGRLLGELSQGYGRLREDAAAMSADMRGAIKESGDSLRASLSETVSEVNKASSEGARAVAQQLQRTTDEEFRRIAQSLDGQVKQLDEAMKDELERALSDMGSQLVSLTRHFVDDYARLRDGLHDALATVSARRA